MIVGVAALDAPTGRAQEGTTNTTSESQQQPPVQGEAQQPAAAGADDATSEPGAPARTGTEATGAAGAAEQSGSTEAEAAGAQTGGTAEGGEQGAPTTEGEGAATEAAAGEEEKPYRIENGVVDWHTFSGFRRYHAECHVCHGPDGLGSSFAPALTESMKTLSYEQYLEIVVNGRHGVDRTKRMPAFGMNKNVMCYVDDIYAYLKARADGALGRGRPAEHEDKPQEAAEAEAACMG